MKEVILRKQIEEQLLKYNKLKKPYETRRRLEHTYSWFGDGGPSIAYKIWAIAIFGSFLVYALPLPAVVHSISLFVMGAALILTPFTGIIGYIIEAIWKANEPRKNRKIEIENRKLYKQLLGIDYNYPNYDNIDYIIAVLNKEIVQENQELPKNPREAYKNPYAYPRYTKSISSNNNARTSGHYANDYTRNKTTQSKYKLCPKCGGKLIIRNGPYGNFYGCSNYPKCRYTRSL